MTVVVVVVIVVVVAAEVRDEFSSLFIQRLSRLFHAYKRMNNT